MDYFLNVLDLLKVFFETKGEQIRLGGCASSGIALLA
jgi:hypothetical protein